MDSTLIPNDWWTKAFSCYHHNTDCSCALIRATNPRTTHFNERDNKRSSEWWTWPSSGFSYVADLLAVFCGVTVLTPVAPDPPYWVIIFMQPLSSSAFSQRCQPAVLDTLWTVTVTRGKPSRKREREKQTQRQRERVKVRGGGKESPVYFIQWKRGTIHNQGRLIHSFN